MYNRLGKKALIIDDINEYVDNVSYLLNFLGNNPKWKLTHRGKLDRVHPVKPVHIISGVDLYRLPNEVYARLKCVY